MASPTAPDGADRAPVAPAPAAYLPPVALHGALSIFDPAVEEWCEYTERFTHYFVANDIVAAEKRRAIFLTAVGPTTYRLLKTLVSPSEFRFEEFVEKAMTHFNSKPSPIVKRYEFNSRCQKEGESVSGYIAELHKIAEHCEFGGVLKDMLRDRLVCGTNNKSIQRRLMFDKAVQTALAAEAADKDALHLTGVSDHAIVEQAPPAHLTPVQTQQPHNAHHSHSTPAPKTECYRCGGRHLASGCPCKELVCHFCKKKATWLRCAGRRRQKQAERSEKANLVQEEDTLTGNEQESE